MPDEAHADFFFNTYLKTQPALINHLKADYMPHYVNYVKASTSSLASPFVTVNNGKVQVVGVSGGQFIVGKWDPQANAFTISSSYLNLAKVNENLPFKVWAL